MIIIKIIYKFVAMLLVGIALINIGEFYSQNQYCLAIEKEFHDKIKITEGNQVSHQQSKAQVQFFKEALDEFRATSPEQVIRIWAKAEETRNGVYHYAVACDNLKSDIIKKWGEAEENFWIVGGSSPWIERYEVVYNEKISDDKYEVVLKFYWISSAGPWNTTKTLLTILRYGGGWCVTSAEER